MKTKIFKLAKTAWKKYPEWIVGVGGASIVAPLAYSSYKKKKRFNKLAKKHKLDPGQDLKSKSELKRFTKLHKEFYNI